MIGLLHCTQDNKRKAPRVRLNVGFQSDLAWWTEFVTSWNGISFLTPLEPVVEMASDASDWGCRVWHGSQWLVVQWESNVRNLDISCRELIPIILAAATWGPHWRGHRMTCHCDNQVVVACLRSHSSSQPGSGSLPALTLEPPAESDAPHLLSCICRGHIWFQGSPHLCRY